MQKFIVNTDARIAENVILKRAINEKEPSMRPVTYLKPSMLDNCLLKVGFQFVKDVTAYRKHLEDYLSRTMDYDLKFDIADNMLYLLVSTTERVVVAKHFRYVGMGARGYE